MKMRPKVPAQISSPSLPPLLNPCNDLVFKSLFCRAPHLLGNLLHAVCSDSLDNPALEIVSILNPQIHPQHVHNKFIVLDILAKTADGTLVNVEMQMQKRQAWDQRGLFYLAKTLAGQLPAGAAYAQLKPVLGIHFLAYDLFPSPAQAEWCFEMRDRAQPQVKLGSGLQLNIIELNKWERLRRQSKISPATHMRSLDAWLTWFLHWRDEDIMNHITHPAVLQAAAQLAIISADEATRQLAEEREMALLTEYLEISAAEKRGMAQAMENALASLLANGIPESEARRLLGLN